MKKNFLKNTQVDRSYETCLHAETGSCLYQWPGLEISFFK